MADFREGGQKGPPHPRAAPKKPILNRVKDTSDTCSCRTCCSRNCLVCIDASSPSNKTSMYRSIATRLKTVRKENHNEYLHNVNITPLSPRIEVMLIDDPENCIVSKSDDVNEHESSLSKTDNNY